MNKKENKASLQNTKRFHPMFTSFDIQFQQFESLESNFTAHKILTGKTSVCESTILFLTVKIDCSKMF